MPAAPPRPPACPRCEGTGFRVVEEGRISRVARCECARVARTERLLASARLPRRYEDRELNNFETETGDLERARNVAFEFAMAWPEVQGGLMFTGPPGRGKTYLAVALLRMLIEKGAAGIFYDFRDLLRAIQGSWDANAQASEMSILQPVITAEVLVLDDLGAGRTSGWVHDTLFHILTSRYNERRVTIVTTNLSEEPPARLQKEETLEGVIGPVLRSRLAEMCRVVRIADAPDYRLKLGERARQHSL